jgi:hypothetical protein
MLRLNRRQRSALSETVRELANLTFAALVLGQFVMDEPISWSMLLLGVSLWAVCVGGAIALDGEGRW